MAKRKSLEARRSKLRLPRPLPLFPEADRRQPMRRKKLSERVYQTIIELRRMGVPIKRAGNGHVIPGLTAAPIDDRQLPEIRERIARHQARRRAANALNFDGIAY